METTKKRVPIYVAVALTLIVLIGSVVAVSMNREESLSVDELLSLGEKYLLDLDYEQALAQFLKVIEMEPMNARAYEGAAQTYLGLGDVDSAIVVLEQGIETTKNAILCTFLDTLNKSDVHETTSLDQISGSEGMKQRESRSSKLTPEQERVIFEIIELYNDDDMDAIITYMQQHNFPELFTGNKLFVQQLEDNRELVLRLSVTTSSSYSVVYGLQVNQLWQGQIREAAIQYDGTKLTSYRKAIYIAENGVANGPYEKYHTTLLDSGPYSSIDTGIVINGLRDGKRSIVFYENGVIVSEDIDYYQNGKLIEDDGSLQEGPYNVLLPSGGSKN